MKTLIVIYDIKSEFILDLIEKYSKVLYIEKYSWDIYNNRRKIKFYQEELGSKNYPLLVFEDENLELIAAIWSESSPDWEKEIKKIIEL